MKARILIVDDEESIRTFLTDLLTRESYAATEAADGAALREQFSGPAPDLILLDLKLPDAEGLDLLPALKNQWPDTEVIVLTGYATLDGAVAATKAGAYDFQKKPFESKSLLLSIERALEHKQLREQASSMRKALAAMSNGAAPIFQSSSMQEVLKTVERIAPTELSVLLTGESGTGKEVIADLIHTLSPRWPGPFIKINCAALPRELIECELFGAVKGAFTGADSDRTGLFQQAHGGTLLLDELAEMPTETQTKLLRVLQEKEARPVGGTVTYKTNCRIVASTNVAIEQAIKTGRLREDLYYRVSGISFHLPPLRERRADISPLAEAFLHRFAAQAGRTFHGFTRNAKARLEGYSWPGNVRQLQNEVQRAVLMTDGSWIDADDLSVVDPEDPSQSGLPLLQGMERKTILQMLKETGGNKLETARRLGIGRQTLYNKLKSYGMD